MTTLRITEPCHESWDAMTPNRQGRHCASCDKTVVDVTALAPTAARSYLDRELPARITRGERVCVRAHADRSGRLLSPGVTRRLLTNGLAAVLAMAAADFAGFGAELGAAETTPDPQTTEPLPGKMGEVEAPRQVMGKPSAPVVERPIAVVSMGAVACPPPAVVEPLVDQTRGLMVTVDPASFTVVCATTGEQSVEQWRVNLSTCGVPHDQAHQPSAMRQEGGMVVIICGDRNVMIDISSGRTHEG